MDFDTAADDDSRRLAVRAWVDAHPHPTGRQLAEAGYVVPHWPAPWGLDADGVGQLIVDEELARAGIARPSNPIGIGWAAPTILQAGTEGQKQRYLWPALAGEEIWCQLFSEPDAGSDLASLRTSAARDGDEWVVTGTKIWTSGAHRSDYGILLARTDPDVPRHRGISYFLCPMHAPGVTVAPIVDMTGARLFNQVFLDDVRLPADALLGAPGDGWRLARATLANERVTLSSGGVLWGSGPSAGDLVRLVAAGGGCTDPVLRQQLAAVKSEGEALRLVRLRSLSARLRAAVPGPEASIQKLMADEHGQHVMAVAARAAGSSAMLAGSGPAGRIGVEPHPGPTVPPAGDGQATTGAADARPDRSEPPAVDQARAVDPVWYFGGLFAPALTIGGGTWAVQRNIIGERMLALPPEPSTLEPSPPEPSPPEPSALEPTTAVPEPSTPESRRPAYPTTTLSRADRRSG